MRRGYVPPAARLAVLVAITLALGACRDTAELIRQVTYPPDFRYVSQDELRSRMDQLAFQLQLLDEALGPRAAEPPAAQEQVVGILRNIERIAGSLQAGDAGSNHPFLEDHMGSFVSEVSQARLAADANPPSFYLAGRVAGGCVNCHRINR